MNQKMASRVKLPSVNEADESKEDTPVQQSLGETTPVGVDSPSAFDLLPKLSPYLDLHMVFPLIQYAESLSNVYKAEDLLRARMELLEFTNMVDYAIEQWKTNRTEPVPPEMTERRVQVVETLKEITAGAQPLLVIVNDAAVVQQLKESGNFNMNYLEGNYGVTYDALANFFAYGKFQFECGNYEKAQSTLALYRELDVDVGSERAFDALWGKLASEILMIVAQWEESTAAAALEDLHTLSGILEARDADPHQTANPLEQLQMRCWMLHWSLFVFFHQTEGRSQIVDFFLLKNRNRNAIETLSPWLLRYVVAAMIANKNRKQKELMMLYDVIEQERYEYSDPVTELLECLVGNFDFERALTTLARCERVLTVDYFLAGLRKDFVDNARTMIFETHCKLNSRIDISMLCSKLQMSSDDAERWIVDVVRNAKLDAKIDLESNSVIMGTPQVVVWDGVSDKTKDLIYRTFNLASGIVSMQREGLL